MKTKSIKECTLSDFQKMRNRIPKDKFTGIVFVPTNEIHHYSEFRCMKFILERNGEIVGVLGGSCDVAAINGIGGYGRYGTQDYRDAVEKDITKRVDWSLDCLPNSNCIRLFSSRCLSVNEWITSTFEFYAGESMYKE